MLRKQYARGSSIIGLYIASLHENGDNLRNNSAYLQKLWSAAPLIVDMRAS
jgi:hypothetical protein